jgi:hypothetical protein
LSKTFFINWACLLMLGMLNKFFHPSDTVLNEPELSSFVSLASKAIPLENYVTPTITRSN